jgi:hypothetical protein
LRILWRGAITRKNAGTYGQDFEVGEFVTDGWVAEQCVCGVEHVSTVQVVMVRNLRVSAGGFTQPHQRCRRPSAAGRQAESSTISCGRLPRHFRRGKVGFVRRAGATPVAQRSEGETERRALLKSKRSAAAIRVSERVRQTEEKFWGSFDQSRRKSKEGLPNEGEFPRRVCLIQRVDFDEARRDSARRASLHVCFPSPSVVVAKGGPFQALPLW